MARFDLWQRVFIPKGAQFEIDGDLTPVWSAYTGRFGRVSRPEPCDGDVRVVPAGCTVSVWVREDDLIDATAALYLGDPYVLAVALADDAPPEWRAGARVRLVEHPYSPHPALPDRHGDVLVRFVDAPARCARYVSADILVHEDEYSAPAPVLRPGDLARVRFGGTADGDIPAGAIVQVWGSRDRVQVVWATPTGRVVFEEVEPSDLEPVDL